MEASLCNTEKSCLQTTKNERARCGGGGYMGGFGGRIGVEEVMLFLYYDLKKKGKQEQKDCRCFSVPLHLSAFGEPCA